MLEDAREKGTATIFADGGGESFTSSENRKIYDYNLNLFRKGQG